MAWRLEFTPLCARILHKLDPPTARRILEYLEDAVRLPDPRRRGRGLTGPLAGFWRYRVGDYRVLCRLEDDRLVALVLEICHRSQGYPSKPTG